MQVCWVIAYQDTVPSMFLQSKSSRIFISSRESSIRQWNEERNQITGETELDGPPLKTLEFASVF